MRHRQSEYVCMAPKLLNIKIEFFAPVLMFALHLACVAIAIGMVYKKCGILQEPKSTNTLSQRRKNRFFPIYRKIFYLNFGSHFENGDTNNRMLVENVFETQNHKFILLIRILC